MRRSGLRLQVSRQDVLFGAVSSYNLTLTCAAAHINVRFYSGCPSEYALPPSLIRFHSRLDSEIESPKNETQARAVLQTGASVAAIIRRCRARRVGTGPACRAVDGSPGVVDL